MNIAALHWRKAGLQIVLWFVLCLQAVAWTLPFPSSARHADTKLFANPVDASPGPEERRKKKRNKYEKFSKVQETDPLERLIAESEQKNQHLEQESIEKEKRKRTPQIQVPAPPPIQFMDAKTIDPYDPTSFGYVEIAQVIGAHGVHGWLKVKSTTDFNTERLCTAGIRHLKPAKKRAPRQVVLLQGKQRQEDEYLLQIQDVEDRDAALRLRGASLYVREEQAQVETPQIQDEEEYLVSDLVSLEVFLIPETEEDMENRQFVGTVGGVVFGDELSTVAGGVGYDYLELVLPRGGNTGMASFRDELVLIPLVPQLVPVVDLENRCIFIDPPTGLLDLTYVRQDKTRIKGFLPSSE